ncbi:hypothetical protein [Vibrio splendidus]|uniref:hypothetical protein n=1 Tax=Vibrio splendidus TaxID=29497 RepID=UPI00080EDDBF|nr:hypothetical protein [Vibrio splendidus]OCH69489.1 hypothetical protein A6D94_22520 [Vibrio splendidus]
MSDFTAIGQLVNEARNLLDSIKGGAIRKMEVAFEALKQTFSDKGNAAIQKIQADAHAALNQVSTSEAMLNSIGFTTMNYNDAFEYWTELTNSSGDKHMWPSGLALYNDARSFALNMLTPEKIAVPSGVEVSQRPAIAQELINYAGFGGKYFPRGGFNILKLTATGSSTGKNGALGFTGFKHESGGGLTFLVYVRSPQTNNQWERKRVVYSRSINGMGYIFPAIDLDFDVGDEIYVALPVLTTGEFPAGVMHGLMPNEARNLYLATK